MSYFMNDLMGETIDDPGEAQIREVPNELQHADEENPDVSLQHESGWSLSIFSDKTLLWENVEDSSVSPREARMNDWETVMSVLMMLSRGDIGGVSEIDWDQ